jgi:hypothetical protein
MKNLGARLIEGKDLGVPLATLGSVSFRARLFRLGTGPPYAFGRVGRQAEGQCCKYRSL